MTSPVLSPIRFGPWPGGLNLRDAEHAADQVGTGQLRRLVNLDVTDSGVLVPRPGARRAGSAAMYAAAPDGFNLLGSWESLSTRYAVVGAYTSVGGGGIGVTTVYYSSNPASSGSWSAMASPTVNGKMTAIAQYGGKTYFVPTNTGSATGLTGYSRTDLGGGTFTAVATMPRGTLAFVVRDRMFVIDPLLNRIYYSKATDPTVWAAPDGGSFDVNPGDGSQLTAAAVINSQLYLFKRGRTYLFTFSTDPGVDGQLTLLNDQLGASSAIVHENGILVANESGVYRLLNNYFVQIDQLVQAPERLGYGSSDDEAMQLSLEGNTLVVGITDGSPYTHLACNLTTGAWSSRTYPTSELVPSTRYVDSRSTGGGRQLLYGHDTNYLTVVRDGPNVNEDRDNQTLDTTAAGTGVISPEYRLATGEADFGDYFEFKRLAWVAARMYRGHPANDAAWMLRTYESPDLVAVAQSVAVPTGVPGVAGGAKVPLERRSYRGFALELRKAQATLSPTVTDPTTSSDVWIRAISGQMDSRGGSADA